MAIAERDGVLGGKNNIDMKMEWSISVPIFKNTIILKQLAIAIGIPFGIIALVILITSGKSVYTLYALGMIGSVLVLTWLFIMLVYRGRYEAEYVLNDQGVLCRTQAKQAKKNRIVNTLTVVLGFLSGKPTVAGAGMLAQSKQAVFIKWNCVRKVKYKPRSLTILIRGGWTENIGLFCTQENYPAIERLVRTKTKEHR